MWGIACTLYIDKTVRGSIQDVQPTLHNPIMVDEQMEAPICLGCILFPRIPTFIRTLMAQAFVCGREAKSDEFGSLDCGIHSGPGLSWGRLQVQSHVLVDGHRTQGVDDSHNCTQVPSACTRLWNLYTAMNTILHAQNENGRIGS